MHYTYHFCDFACPQGHISGASGAERSQPRGLSLPGVGPLAQRQEAISGDQRFQNGTHGTGKRHVCKLVNGHLENFETIMFYNFYRVI